MNKNLKGAIAVGAATILLLGGGGTLAVWNSSVNVAAGTISSGDLLLTMSEDAEGHWYRYDANKELSEYGTPLAADYRVVPEDHLIFIQDGVTLSGLGGELYFTFGASLTTANANGFSVGNVTVLDVGGDLPAGDPAGEDEYRGVDENTTVYGGVDVDFDADVLLGVEVTFNANGVQYQGETFDLGTATINVEQVIKN